jgi:hypothetical protein
MSATEHRLSTAGGALECWSFVSDGLAALGQKELVFTFARQRDESIDPLAGQVGRLLITIRVGRSAIPLFRQLLLSLEGH